MEIIQKFDKLSSVEKDTMITLEIIAERLTGALNVLVLAIENSKLSIEEKDLIDYDSKKSRISAFLTGTNIHDNEVI